MSVDDLRPNGELINLEGHSLLRELVRGVQDRFKNNHNLASLGPFKAVVCGLYGTDTWSCPIDDEARTRRMHRAPPSGRVKIHAHIEGITLLPRPSGFMTIDPSGQRPQRQNTFLLDRILALPRFVAKTGDTRRPQLGELVYVDWLRKPGNNTEDWVDPVYLGPVGTEKAIIISLKTTAPQNAQQAFNEQGLGQGQVQISGDGLIDDKFVFNNMAPGYPNVPMKGLLEASGLAYLTKEIYVDKELDYSEIKKYDIIPGSTIVDEKSTKATSLIQHRPKNKSFMLPNDVTIKPRKATKLFIIKESGKSYIETYKKIRSNPTMHYNIAMNSVFNGDHAGLETKSVNNKNRLCTIRVNLPYGVVIDEGNVFSANSVGCVVSSPFDGKFFFGSDATWDPRKPTNEINKSPQFANFKSKLNQWIANKKLPDGSEPFILGPWGTPGLRTGILANQNLSVSSLSNSQFWSGRLKWSPTGHYFLPTLDQVDALYELITSILENPPKSAYSWAHTKPTRHRNSLAWNFPAVGGGSPLFSMSHFINTQGYFLESAPAFPWGQVGPLMFEKNNKPRHLWENGLKQRGEKAIFGIVSYSRWGTDSAPFIEYYILSRKLGLGHMEAWYVSLAIAAETMPKIHKGKGLGPTKIPAFGDISLNKYLEIGQKMWFKALKYLREEEAIVPTEDQFAESGGANEGDEPQSEFNVVSRCEFKGD